MMLLVIKESGQNQMVIMFVLNRGLVLPIMKTQIKILKRNKVLSP